MAAASARKEQITVAKRLEILRKLEEGANVDQLAAEHGLHKRTIQRIRKNAASIREFSESPSSMHLKKKRVLLHEDVDTQLYAWIVERRGSGDTITDNRMQEKARELHEQCAGPSNFTASRGWLRCFKRRHGIDRAGIHGERSDENEQAADKFMEDLWSVLVDENIAEEDVYNVDETSLMWKALPRGTLVRENKRFEGEKVKKDRVSVAFCANATGTHKLPLLFVNKYTNPRATKHCKHILPVVYKSQNNGVIDETVFSDWYANHFKPSVRQHQSRKQRMGKVLLLVGNCGRRMLSRQTWEDFEFKVMFLPPGTTSIVQPMDQGVIAECKTFFRHKLLRRVLQHNEVRQFYADYDVKDCIDLISEAWDAVTVESIRNSWKKLLDRPAESPESPESPESYFEVHVKEEFDNSYVHVKKEFDNPCIRVKEEFENSDARDKEDQFGESMLSEEISEWISECERAELTEEKEETDTQPRCRLEDEEIDHMFNNLATWAETQTEYVKLHAKFLIDYYNLK